MMDEITRSHADSIPGHIRCPRCDYELDGVIAAFTDQCPLQGTCSECGMEFEWANLLRADRRQLPWLFEHTRHPVRGVLGTLWKSLFPGRFWNAVQMWHVPRVGRLWLYVALCGGVFLLLVSMLMAAIDIGVYYVAGGFVVRGIRTTSPEYWWQVVEQLILYPFAHEEWWGAAWSVKGMSLNTDFMLMPIGCFWGMNLSWPVMMLLLSDSRLEAKVKRTHVLRGWAYSLWWGMVITIMLLVLRTGILATDICDSMGWTWMKMQLINARNWGWQVLLSYDIAYGIALTLVLALYVWTARWWWVVIVRYWRFSRPGLVYWLLFAVSLLALLIPGVPDSYELLPMLNRWNW